MSWEVMSEGIESIYIYKVNDKIDLSKYNYNTKIITGKVLYVYYVSEMDDWSRTRATRTLKETPYGTWLVSLEPIDELKEYKYKDE